MADVECPFCNSHLRAGRQCKRTIWTGLVLGGLFAGCAAYSAWHLLGWSITSGILIIIIISIIVAALLSAYSWYRNDFFISG